MRTIVLGLLAYVLGPTVALAQLAENEASDTTALLDTASIAVLPVEALSVDPAYADIASAVYQHVTYLLSDSTHWTIVSPERVEAFVEAELQSVEWAKQLGAATVLESSVSPSRDGFSYRYAFVDVATGSHHLSGSTYARASSDSSTHLSPQLIEQIDDAVASFADIFQRRSAFDRDRKSAKAVARHTFLDSTKSADERLQALLDLCPPTMGESATKAYADNGESLSGEVALAAIELAQSSADPKVRGTVWNIMHGVPDRSLVTPLLAAVENDPDAMVRRIAATALETHALDPNVTEVLQLVVDTDADVHVQEAAFFASATPAGRLAHLRSKVLDDNLSGWERRTAMYRISTLYQSEPLTVDAELVNGLASWARSLDDRSTRGSIWYVVGQLGGTTAPSVLTTALANEPDETVRESIVSALHQLIDEPGVRDTLVRAAEEDESPLVRKAAQWSLERSAVQ
ncbi:MAG: HEAT repeat domain-containing protein [Pseudomonadota bacterium]